MIVDINAFAGHWPGLAARSDAGSVRGSLTALGVDAIFMSPLDVAWSRNARRANPIVYEAADRFPDVFPVPVLDPTVAGWRKELAQAAAHPRVRMVKLLPAYGPYGLEAADELLAAVARARLAVLIQTRMEDPRSQHPLAQVPDLPAPAVADAARRHPDLTVIIGGGATWVIRDVGGALRELPNLYAEVAQADGIDCIKGLAAVGLTGKLLFGSHAPLFVPWSALARVVLDLNDEDAAAVLGGNAVRALNLH